jgi:hypothetical protein
MAMIKTIEDDDLIPDYEVADDEEEDGNEEDEGHLAGRKKKPLKKSITKTAGSNGKKARYVIINILHPTLIPLGKGKVQL